MEKLKKNDLKIKKTIFYWINESLINLIIINKNIKIYICIIRKKDNKKVWSFDEYNEYYNWIKCALIFSFIYLFS